MKQLAGDSMRIYLFGVIASSLIGCGSSQPAGPIGTDPLAQTTGSYAGAYRVPTATDELASAARYPMDSVDWTVVGNTVTLHYDLPLGLVGGDIDVTLTGTLAPGATVVELSGSNATGTCTQTGTLVSCTEIFGDLGTLPISMAVVQRVSAGEYPGPVDHRERVAHLFGSDPIGIADFDLTTPEIEDDDDDDIDEGR